MNISGPFKEPHMKRWKDKGTFPADTQVCMAGWPKGHFMKASLLYDNLDDMFVAPPDDVQAAAAGN